MSITAKQYHSFQFEACRMAEELPKNQLLDSLIATYEAGRLLHMSKSALLGLLGSVAMRCIDDQVDDAAPPVPPAAGMWPRVIREAGYDELGNLLIEGIDDNDRAGMRRFRAAVRRRGYSSRCTWRGGLGGGTNGTV